MNRIRTPHLLLAAALATAAIAGCKKKEDVAVTTPPATPATMAMPAPAPMPTATTTVTSVDLGTAVGPDMKVTAPASTFKPKDTIIAAVSTSTSDPAASVPGTLGVKWTHVDSSQTVHEESKDVNFSGMGVTDFQISKPDGWPTGKYKVEVSLDGNVVQSRDFEVK